MTNKCFESSLEELSGFLDTLVDVDESCFGIEELRAAAATFSDIHQQLEMCFYDKSISESPAKMLYRAKVGSAFAEAAIVSRNIERPRGYHGDYETMEMMYRNGWEGSTSRGKIIHKMLVSGRECSSVRERCRYLSERLLKLSGRSMGNQNVLALASGPAAEIRGIDLSESGLTIYLLDQDIEALEYSMNLLTAKQRKHVIPVCCDVREFFDSVPTELKGLRFNYIYSAGLFDYLNDRLGSAIVKTCISLLSPSGLLEIGNFSVWPASFFVDMVCGWRLFLRGEPEIYSLIPEGVDCECFDVADQIFVRVAIPATTT